MMTKISTQLNNMNLKIQKSVNPEQINIKKNHTWEYYNQIAKSQR